jgi:molecular chaperone GrpE (heat shock protein)
VQEAIARSSSEIAQLKQTVQALREEMENHRIRHREEMQSARVTFRDENQHLKDMIVVLRDQMEKANAR